MAVLGHFQQLPDGRHRIDFDDLKGDRILHDVRAELARPLGAVERSLFLDFTEHFYQVLRFDLLDGHSTEAGQEVVSHQGLVVGHGLRSYLGCHEVHPLGCYGGEGVAVERLTFCFLGACHLSRVVS